MVRSAGTGVPVVKSAAAECLVRGARVLHAEPERRALLGRAEHVGGLDVDLLLAEADRRTGERARLVGEAHLDHLAVAGDAVLLRLDRAARLCRVLVVDDDVDGPDSATGRRGDALHTDPCVPERACERSELTCAVRQLDRELYRHVVPSPMFFGEGILGGGSRARRFRGARAGYDGPRRARPSASTRMP